MINTNYHSAVIDYLRTGYGVTDAEVVHGTKHDRVAFTYNSRAHKLTLARGGRQEFIDMKLQDVRRILGPPIQPDTTREKRSLEDMMPEPFNPVPMSVLKHAPKRAPVPTKCRVALYSDLKSGKLRLRFSIPDTLSAADWSGVGAKALDNAHWELWEDPTQTRRWKKGDSTGSLKVDVLDLNGIGDTTFGSSPAELIEVDGRLMITCPVATRLAIASVMGKHKRQRKRLHKTEIVLQPAKMDMTMYRDRMLAVLRDISMLERETEWRLIRVKDEGVRCWEWHAPPVRLEE